VLNLPSLSDGIHIKCKFSAAYSINKLLLSVFNDAGEMAMARITATGTHAGEQLLSVLVVIEADVADGTFFCVVHLMIAVVNDKTERRANDLICDPYQVRWPMDVFSRRSGLCRPVPSSSLALGELLSLMGVM
jgi:hypothetical protein